MDILLSHEEYGDLKRKADLFDSNAKNFVKYEWKEYIKNYQKITLRVYIDCLKIIHASFPYLLIIS